MTPVIQKATNFFSLACGNNKTFNTKVKGYRKKISASIITVYLAFFGIGIALGDLSTSTAINIENLVGLVATVAVAGFGFNILYDSWQKKLQGGWLIHASVLTVMAAQTAYIFNLYSLPIVNTMFEMVTILSMIILYGVSTNRR